MQSDRSGTPHSHREVHTTPQGIRGDSNGYGSWESTDGVETSRCMDNLVCRRRYSEDPEDATWQAVFEATRLQNCHGQGQITSEMQQYMKQRKGG